MRNFAILLSNFFLIHLLCFPLEAFFLLRFIHLEIPFSAFALWPAMVSPFYRCYTQNVIPSG